MSDASEDPTDEQEGLWFSSLCLCSAFTLADPSCLDFPHEISVHGEGQDSGAISSKSSDIKLSEDCHSLFPESLLPRLAPPKS
jgi:hypothetical protein